MSISHLAEQKMNRQNAFAFGVCFFALLLAGISETASAQTAFTDIRDTSQILDGDGNVIIDFGAGYNTNVNGNLTDTLVNGSTYSRVISGTGTVTVNGAGSASPNVNAWTLTGVSTYTGTTTVTSGAVLALATNNAIAQSSGVAIAGTVSIGATNQTLHSISGAGAINATSGTLTENGTASWGGVISGGGNVATTGAGNWTLTAAQTYTGTTNVANGTTLTLSTTNNEIQSSSGVTVNGTLVIGGTRQQVTGLAGSGSVTTTSDGVLTETGTASWGGVISGAGSLAVAGTGDWTITAAQTFTGAATIASGATVTLSTTNNELQSSSSVVVNGTLAIGTTQQQLTGLTGSGAVTIGNSGTLTESGNATWSGTISGTGNVATTGAGTWSIATAQSYTGTTNVANGTTLNLTLTNNEIQDSSGVTVNGTLFIGNTAQQVTGLTGAGSVVTNSGGTLTESGTASWGGVISGAGNLATTGTGNWTLTAAQTYTGTTNVANGTTLTLSGVNNEIQSSSGVTVNGTMAIGTTQQQVTGLTGSGSVTTAASGTLTESGTASWGGVISGAGNLATTGTGNWTLTAAQTYTGTTNVANGTTLTLSGVNNEIQSSSGVTVNGTMAIGTTQQQVTGLTGSGSVTTASGGVLTDSGTSTWAGVISGAGRVATTGTGTWTLTGNNSYTGTTTIGSGTTLSIASENNIGGSSSIVMNASTLRLTGNTTITQGIAMTGDANFDIGANTDVLSGVLSGAGNLVVPTNTGSLSLTNTETYTGTTTLGAGNTLVLTTTDDTIATSSGVTNNGTINMTGTNQTFKSLGGSGNVVTSSGKTLTENGTATFSGVISGAGSVVTTGTGNWTLSGINTYTGSTTVNSGATLSLGIADAIAQSVGIIINGTLDMTGTDQTFNNLSGSGNILLNGGTLTENGTDTFTGVVGDGATTGGGLRVIGGGTWRITGANTYIGTTEITSGSTLQDDGSVASSLVTVDSGATLKGIGSVAGAVVNNGNVSPGDSPGTLTVGSYTQNSGGRLNIEFDMASHDQLVVGGAANLSGIVNYIPLATSSKYVRGKTYTIISASGGRNGAFTKSSDGSTMPSNNIETSSNNSNIANFSNSALAIKTIYDNNSVKMKIERAEFFANASGATSNQKAAGAALDSIQLTAQDGGDMDTVLNALSAVPSSKQAAALEYLTGEINADVQKGFLDNEWKFDQLLSNDLSSDCSSVDIADAVPVSAAGAQMAAAQAPMPTPSSAPAPAQNSRWAAPSYVAAPMPQSPTFSNTYNQPSQPSYVTGANRWPGSQPQPMQYGVGQPIAYAAPPQVQPVMQIPGMAGQTMPMLPSYQAQQIAFGAPRTFYQQPAQQYLARPIDYAVQPQYVQPQPYAVAPQLVRQQQVMQPQMVQQPQIQQPVMQQPLMQQAAAQPVMQQQVMQQPVPYAYAPQPQPQPQSYYAPQQQAAAPQRAAPQQAQAAPVAAYRGKGRSKLWACGYGSFAHTAGDGNTSALKSTYTGAAVGLEKRVNSAALFRAALGYGHDSFSLNATGDDASLNTFNLGLYGQYKFRNNVYVGGTFAGSYNSGDTERNVTFGTINRKATGSPTAYSLTTAGTLGYEKTFGRIRLGLDDHLAYIWNNRGSYEETGAGAADLSVDSKSVGLLRNAVGAKAAMALRFGRNGTHSIIPEAHVAYLYDITKLSPSATQSFAGTSAAFEVKGANQGRSAVQGGAGMSLRISPYTSLFGDYTGTFLDHGSDHAVVGGFKYRW